MRLKFSLWTLTIHQPTLTREFLGADIFLTFYNTPTTTRETLGADEFVKFQVPFCRFIYCCTLNSVYCETFVVIYIWFLDVLI